MAAAGAIAAPAIAEAQIVYSGPLNTTTYGGSNMTLLFQGTPTDGSEPTLFIVSGKKGAPTKDVRVDDFGDTAIDFTPATLGATVDASRTFSTPSTPAALGNVVGSSYYYAFAYSPAGEDLYGWFHYTLGLDGSRTTMTLNDWAYNSVAGESIAVGQTVSAIPEPAEVGALLGVAALATVWVRRRKHRTARRS